MVGQLPQPRQGLLGAWDKFVGPGMTVGETLLIFGASAGGAALSSFHLFQLDRSLLQILLGALMAFDVIGGAVCNCTETTKRWFHRPGLSAYDQLGFIAVHVFHIGLVAVFFCGRSIDIVYFGLTSCWLLISAGITVFSPDRLKLPVAVSCFLVSLVLAFYVLTPTPGLEWFIPVLFVKLLIGHAVPPGAKL